MKEKLKKAGNSPFICIISEMAKSFQENEVLIYSGYSTFRILISIIPLIMLTLAAVNILPWFSTEDFKQTLYGVLPDIPQIRSLVSNIIRNLDYQYSGVLASVAAVVILWTASGVVVGIQNGLIRIVCDAKKTKYDRGFAIIYTLGFLILIMGSLLFQVLGRSINSLVASTAEYLGIPNIISHVGRIISIGQIVIIVFIFMFALLVYRFLPGGKRSVKVQIPGTIFTTVSWELFSVLFSFFIPKFWKTSSLYGSLASVFLASLWIYYMMMILFLGAILNEVLIKRKKEKTEKDI